MNKSSSLGCARFFRHYLYLSTILRFVGGFGAPPPELELDDDELELLSSHRSLPHIQILIFERLFKQSVAKLPYCIRHSVVVLHWSTSFPEDVLEEDELDEELDEELDDDELELLLELEEELELLLELEEEVPPSSLPDAPNSTSTSTLAVVVLLASSESANV